MLDAERARHGIKTSASRGDRAAAPTRCSKPNSGTAKGEKQRPPPASRPANVDCAGDDKLKTARTAEARYEHIPRCSALTRAECLLHKCRAACIQYPPSCASSLR